MGFLADRDERRRRGAEDRSSRRKRAVASDAGAGHLNVAQARASIWEQAGEGEVVLGRRIALGRGLP